MADKINPAWVTAPYDVGFLIGVPVPKAVRGWSRRRRLRWVRRATRHYPGYSGKSTRLPNPVFDSAVWESFCWCNYGVSRPGVPHAADCAYAGGN